MYQYRVIVRCPVCGQVVNVIVTGASVPHADEEVTDSKPCGGCQAE